MKGKVIKVFFDNNGIHKIGEIVEVENFDERLVEPIKETEKVGKKPSKNKE